MFVVLAAPSVRNAVHDHPTSPVHGTSSLAPEPARRTVDEQNPGGAPGRAAGSNPGGW
jgi:hypothetical protein